MNMREFGSEFASLTLPDAYFTSICSGFKDSVFLRSGRDALGVVAQNITLKRKRILLPAYCCDSIVYPFIRNGWEVRYYPLNDDLTVDLASLAALIDCYFPDAILVMNYFGIASTVSAVKKIKDLSSEVIIIEDFTHCLFDMSNLYNEQVDYYIASIRKWLGVNDGGIILTKHPIHDRPIYKENDFVEIRRKAQLIKRHYGVTGNPEEKNVYRTALKEAELYLADTKEYVGISSDSLDILNSLNVSEIKYRRKKNYFHLFSLIKDIESIAFPNGITDVNTPFSLPILIENRDMIQGKLAACKLYVPVLWPIDNEARNICSVSVRMADHMLSIPIDQRYDYNDIEDISQIIHSVLN